MAYEKNTPCRIIGTRHSSRRAKRQCGQLGRNSKFPQNRIFIDTESIRQIDASTYSMWYKTSNSDGSYELSLGYFDTQQVAFIISSVVAYDANGNVIGSETRKPYEYILNWQPIIPGTISEALYSYATGSSAY